MRPTPDSLTVRAFEVSDLGRVEQVTRVAFESEFGTAIEVGLLRSLRESEPELIEMVAVDEGQVVGHVAVSTARSPERVGCLGPMSVSPAVQGRGIGSTLVLAALDECWARGYRAVVLVGHPGFYARAGFRSASAGGWTLDMDVPDEAFMVAYDPGRDPMPGGPVRYPAAFYEAAGDV